MAGAQTRPWFILGLLFAINTVNFFDRQLLPAVAESIRIEWRLTDAHLGWLATSFTLLYALAGLPFGRLADIRKRTHLLAAGLAAWSIMTYLSGWSTGFRSLFMTRLGVGIGEAACAPAATSLIGDIFPADRRARALAIFMLGLPLGLALSYAMGGIIAQVYGWRAAFYVAAAPGIVLAFAVLAISEPQRCVRAKPSVGSPATGVASIRKILQIPTMWFIILSGALHNFNLYAVGTFLPTLLMRHHHASLKLAGLVSAIIIGGMGAVGMVAGGWAGDFSIRRSSRGRMVTAALALASSLPPFAFAISLPSGSTLSFAILLGVSYALMYTYYPLCYATIQDVVEPSLRGTAMAVYFCAMYLFGASAGPIATGWFSDRLALGAARSAEWTATMATSVSEVFRAAGVRQAMFVIPALGVLLVGILAAASATVGQDLKKIGEIVDAGGR